MLDDGSCQVDGRRYIELRRPQISLGAIGDSSVRYSIGRTSVIAVVNGPCETSNHRRAYYDGGSIEVYIEGMSDGYGLPDSGIQKMQEKSSEVLIESYLESIVDVTEFPNCILSVTIIVVEDDGSLLSAAMNAAVCAFVHKGIPLKMMSIAVSLGLESETHKICLDPCSSQPLEATWTAAVAFPTVQKQARFTHFWPETGKGIPTKAKNSLALVLAAAQLGTDKIGATIQQAFQEKLNLAQAVASLNNLS